MPQISPRIAQEIKDFFVIAKPRVLRRRHAERLERRRSIHRYNKTNPTVATLMCEGSPQWRREKAERSRADKVYAVEEISDRSPYVIVRASRLFYFKVHKTEGTIWEIHGRKPRGLLRDFLDPQRWDDGSVLGDGGIPRFKPKPCGQCGRPKSVKSTVNGSLCQYCRGSDTRHIGALRKLGGMPTMNGKPIANYLQE